MPRRALAVYLGALVALSAGACVPSQAENEYDFGSDSTMRAIQRRGEVVIAFPDGLAPFATLGDDGEPEGFVAELAREIVRILDVDATYVVASGDRGLDLLDRGEVDLAFPVVGITERLARQNNFSGPYWIAHKRLLVPVRSDIESVDDLSGEAVCQFDEERTSVDIYEINPDIDTIDVEDFRDCIRELREGRALAATAPDLYLMAMADELDDYEIRGRQLGTAGYGAAAPVGTPDMTTFLNRVLTEVKSEGRWLEYYRAWLAPMANIEGANAPDLTLEEAATLWPRHLD